jgi:hypothetical protein
MSILNYGPIVEELESDLGLSTVTLAQALEVDRRTIERWQGNRSVPQGKTRERLAELIELRDYMVGLLGSADSARAWLKAESLYLGGFTPEEALKAGRMDRVRADLDGLAAGIYL